MLAMAVSEESIGASPQSHPQHHTDEETGPTVPQEAAPAQQEAAPEPAAPIAPAENPVAPTENSPETPRTLQPHATFPYTIRPGDNLGLIASEFGISVADLTRVNRVNEETELVVGETLRIPNPGVARERELTAQINQLTQDQQTAEQQAQKSQAEVQPLQTQIADLTAELHDANHDLRGLSWWRGGAYVLGALALLMFGAMALALLDWWILRNRFRAVAEMNESLRNLDYKYKSALAKAELRMQELYGRRRRGIRDGQERPKLAEEAEIERLNHELKTVLERHLERLGPAGASARRARWHERVSGMGSPVEARPARR